MAKRLAKTATTATNKRNLVWFEAPSMLSLYRVMDEWQVKHQKRLLSLSIHRDKGRFCCIALTNAAEVIIVDGGGSDNGVDVTDNALKIYT